MSCVWCITKIHCVHEKIIKVLKDNTSDFSSGQFSFLFRSFVISSFKIYNLSSINMQLDSSTTNECLSESTYQNKSTSSRLIIFFIIDVNSSIVYLVFFYLNSFVHIPFKHRVCRQRIVKHFEKLILTFILCTDHQVCWPRIVNICKKLTVILDAS